ncbi:MAG: filamentous hemagglutinin N-terminal domain-containing protein [Okeania sp. SIO2G4]|uniref:two-partner secretion domain-containing protein n=1 Tax=unclassified Okeania TaxID=2634635 RepID=UPI0013BCA4DF|nr:MULTISPECIES: filamentous hemagglutinin N-terminal domain-containing protein [unclassified Okeania]NEP74091.1 filamentous hemagglutinin N-terminal domain-containing protein [Okeania sp. SIO2G5]NEP95299.1 filamentous hemagglutinin N-terminal domain-containing protein [Okeania sp. SIO2F5]NEQ91967.1 filamentous hemagglutinin N-terminal domain-containing protein [Okeania sp. SIO2G4]
MKLKSLPILLSSTSGIWLILSSLFCQNQGNTQIIPDQTLGKENSVINSIDRLKEQIEGGAIRGSNLFHSFQEFNVGENRSVYFTNPAEIENILTRITGNNASNILGNLGVLGEANLFLVNPNGILFGPNSSLDIRGSFIATTADEIRLGENGLFSATNFQNSNLLSIKPSALFFNQIASQTQGNIVSKSTAEEIGLQVPSGEILGLIGREVIIDSGKLTTEQGRIEIGSVGDNSLVRLENTNNYTLNYSEVENFKNIQIKNGAVVDVSGEGSGDIQLQGRQVSITGGSTIVANTLGSEPGGSISLISSELLEVTESFVNADVGFAATGSGATITTNAPRLILTSGGQISTATFGTGTSGELTINANEIEVMDISADGQNLSGIFTDVLPGATGRGGDITINTQNLKLFNGGQLGANIFGAGQGGNLTVNATEIEASDTIVFETTVPQQELLLESLNGQFPSAILALVIPEATGNSGKLTINSDRIVLRNGAQIGTGTFGAGDSGELAVQAREIEVSGISEDGFLPSSFFTTVLLGATGQGGNLTIDTQSLTLQNGGQVRAGTSGVGDSGDVTVTAKEINLQGSFTNDFLFLPSTIQAAVEDFSTVDPSGIGSGDGGEILINTDRLTVEDGGTISARTEGEGKGGNIEINATDIEVNNSFITADSNESAAIIRNGDGGNLTINTQNLMLTNGGSILASTSSEGKGGNIEINATEIEAVGISPDGQFLSGINSQVALGSTGDGGNLTIDTQRLILRDGAIIQAAVFSSGQGGSIAVNAKEVELSGNATSENLFPEISSLIQSINGQVPSGLLTTVLPGATGNGGNLAINTQGLQLKDGGSIGTGTFAQGQSGDLTVRATEINMSGTILSGKLPSSLFTSVFDGATGNGGNLTVDTERLSLRNGAQVRAGTSGVGDSGDLKVRATEIELVGRAENGELPSSILASVEDLRNLSLGVGSGDGGNAFIETEHLTILDGAEVSASTFGDGKAGNLTVSATENITLSGVNSISGDSSTITARTLGNGNAGSININTPNLRVEDQAIVTVSSSGNGVAGSLNINAPSIELNNGTLSAETTAGNQGNITIQVSDINLENNSAITTNATESATGGDINIDAQFIVSSDNSNISANAIEGRGGNISINAQGVFLDNSSQITATSTLGIDGTVDINTQVDPTQGVVRLSATVIDPQSLVANNICAPTQAQKEGSSFVITGRGGLPPDPTQPLTVLRGMVEWETETSGYTSGVMRDDKQPVVVYHRSEVEKLPEIRQAQGWVMTESGTIILTTTVTTVNSGGLQLIHPSCYLFSPVAFGTFSD